MNPVSFTAAAEPTFYGVADDHSLRRRLRAELLEIEEEIKRNSDDEIAELLAEWQKNFWESLSHHDEKQVIERFLQKLESIFENPLRPGSFSPRLFGDRTSSLVRFIIAKMRDRNSLLYSSKLERSVPESSLSRISDVQARSLNTPEQTNLQSLKERLIKRKQEQAEKFQALEKKIQELDVIGQEIQATREEINHFDRTVENLEKETLEHKDAVEKLEGEIAGIKENTDELKKQNLELDKRCHMVDKAIKEKKKKILSSIGYAALSISLSLALNYFLPGSSAVIFQGGGTIGLAKPF